MTERTQNADFRGISSFWRAQETADFRRKPKIFLLVRRVRKSLMFSRFFLSFSKRPRKRTTGFEFEQSPNNGHGTLVVTDCRLRLKPFHL